MLSAAIAPLRCLSSLEQNQCSGSTYANDLLITPQHNGHISESRPTLPHHAPSWNQTRAANACVCTFLSKKTQTVPTKMDLFINTFRHKAVTSTSSSYSNVSVCEQFRKNVLKSIFYAFILMFNVVELPRNKLA